MKVLKEKLFSEPLEDIDNHVQIKGIDRWVANGIPLHCAIHKVDMDMNPKEYCSPHSHASEDELNILINDKDCELAYRFIIDGDDFMLSAPAYVWIPSNTLHTANAVSGRGTFLCMRFPEGSLRNN